jgi:hypothetical protein
VTHMPGLVLHAEAVITCAHGGLATVVPTQVQALVNALPIATFASQITVEGCAAPVPCTLIQWLGFTPRVLAGGQFVLLQPLPPVPPPVPGQGVAVGSPPPIPLVYEMQLRVTGT